MKKIHVICIAILSISQTSSASIRAQDQQNHTAHSGASDLRREKFDAATKEAQDVQQSRVLPKHEASVLQRPIPGLPTTPSAAAQPLKYKRINRKKR